MRIQIKRAYDKYSTNDGYRILVDDLWPRGISKKKSHLNLWFKGIGPSTNLRKWYSHDESKWIEFKKDYLKELRKNKNTVNDLLDIIDKHKKVTLIYSSKSPKNNAVVLLNFLLKFY